MKRWNLSFGFWILCVCLVAGQSAPKFTAEVSTDSVLMENYFEVKFTLENGQGKNFEPPSFSDFQIVGGPNQSSNFSMINGEVKQSMTFSFFLQPKEAGNYCIQPASISVNGEILETQPLSITVAPNPDGIIQNIEKSHQFLQDFDFWNGSESEPVEPQQPKKKRKIYKM